MELPPKDDPSSPVEKVEEQNNFLVLSPTSSQHTGRATVKRGESHRSRTSEHSSPEPAVIHMAEAFPTDIDDYGVAAALEMDIEESGSSEYSSSRRKSTQALYQEDDLAEVDGATEDDAPEPKPFDRTSSLPQTRKGLTHTYEKVSEIGMHNMHKFSLYETQARYYLVGGDVADKNFRMLKIDRTSPPGQLSIVEDDIIYTKREMNQLLNAIDDGNKAVGGMKLKANAWGLLGFIRFTEAYYMLMVTKKSQVAMIGGHYIHQIDGTELVPLTTGPSSQFKTNRNPEEAHFLSILNNLDLHRSFYFSYSYNVTRTLQYNIIKERQQAKDEDTHGTGQDFNDMFVWNHHLLSPALEVLNNPYDWCLPIVHGFIDQSCVNVFGTNLYITILARRSRFFAGARFLKRGANDLGYVANDVETEQIVANMAITSFNAPGCRTLKNPNYTSYVQHRGSIPLYWTQDNSGVSPKPAIDLNLKDPFYAAPALHFDNLFERYGAPVCVLNLVKARERTPRESKLLNEYRDAIKYLNQSLPEGKKIIYRAYDMSRAAKTQGQDVIATLEKMARELVQITGFFQNGNTFDEPSIQNGVIRSNCIDCLDRTNAAQFVIGKRALALQLQALGVIADDSLNYDSDATNLFAHMFNDHGDTLASQYGGSHLVNTTDSYRKINNWQSHSRDMLESFKRYYHNSFLDNQRQEAYNLFLGNYIFAQGQPMLWELPNDYYLHHTNPSARAKKQRRHYISWFTPEFLEVRVLPPVTDAALRHQTEQNMPKSDWWYEYYRPQMISSLLRVFAYRMNSTTRYLPKHPSNRFDMSPFSVRKSSHDADGPLKKLVPKDPEKTNDNDSQTKQFSPLAATSQPKNPAKRITSLQKWLHGPQSQQHDNSDQPSPKGTQGQQNSPSKQQKVSANDSFKPADKNNRNQWTLGQFVLNSLHPSVSTDETAEYERYITHPLQLPLVVSPDDPMPMAPDDTTAAEFLEYIDRAKPGGVLIADSISTNETVGGSLSGVLPPGMTSTELGELNEWLHIPDDPLKVREEDGERKRYQAYGKWLRGKSLFKQSKVDPESG